MTVLIDYDAGNLKSVQNALEMLGEETMISGDRETILAADRVILPGVGAFGESMKKLDAHGLTGVIHELAERNIPLLGICLGLQLLFEASEENPETKGIGLFPGKVSKFSRKNELKIPHMGWNTLQIVKESKLLEGIEHNAYVYFVHSYYLQAEEKDIVVASCEYGNSFDAVIEKGNVFACQFHPEKSSDVGMQILRNFLKQKRG